ncbi:MAG: SDR family NAD(P)-dependent oxidoreductase [Candidatus Microthrix sp.]|nr:SDR family NAD(P)-dependent oxidoreductase [Candidatus Microthrix sp.]MBK6437467.1 SDR family NAD(P)-dependent oxidoreductase [Candidatus Microthrix sp.]
MSGRFSGRRAIVTGASRGIGAGVAERLAAEGAAMALVARTVEGHDRLVGSLQETADRLAVYGVPVALVPVDLSDPEARSRVVDTAAERLGGPIDILVNNAAAAMYGDVADLSLKRRRLLFELNVHAPFDLAQAAIPAMRAAGQGWIVNMSSASARSWAGPPFDLGSQGATTAAYGASKAALNRMTNGLGAELDGTGIRVNTIEPRAAVLTEGADALVGGTLRADQVETLEQMVEAVVALCDCPADVTGASLVSGDLLDEWGIEVRRLDGSALDESATN